MAGLTYRAAVQHAAGDTDPGRELEALPLQRLVHLADVDELAAAFGGRRPRLGQLEDLGPDFLVDGGGPDGLEQRREVVHELPRGNLGEEV